jgi:thymidylate synthase
MKKYKELMEEVLNEGSYKYPADDMTMKELKIACYAAQNILDRLEDGAMIQRWQISAIVKASEELASVYTSMSADEEDEDEMGDEYDDEYEDEIMAYEYPWMGESVELEESNGLRFGVDKMPKKLIKDLRDLADHALGYDFHDKGISVSFDKQVDKKKLAQYLGAKEYDIDYEGKSGNEHIYNVSE